jgi:phage/plasmid primase-like uncharacterized protein
MIPAHLVQQARATLIERVLDERGIQLRGRTTRSGPCPVCGGHDRFGVDLRKRLFNCRQCQRGGDVIALVQHLDGVGFAEAVQTLAGVHSAQPCAAKLEHKRDDGDERRRLRHAGRVWDEARPIIGTPGAAYLASRGILLDQVPEQGGLRWHPSCPWERATTPCIVARFTDAITGEPRGIHRRPIKGGKPKSLGPTGECLIRLWPNDAISEGLVIGEGVETVLAAATRITHKGTLLQPAWACGSAGNLANFPVLAGIETITILVDHDENGVGERKAAQCAQRWREAGREVIQLMPRDVGADFNDMVRQ